MLTRLEINDFAIIDQVQLDLGPGLNVFTGETGAGKSILLDALGAALGIWVGSEVVRSGAHGARVDALFVARNGRWPEEALPLLEQMGVEPTEVLLLTREIRGDKPNLCRINQRIVPLKTLSEVGSFLAEVHTQGEQWRLGNRKYQLALLDRHRHCTELREKAGAGVKDLRRLQKELEQLMQRAKAAERETNLLHFQVDEIDKAKLVAGEDEALQHELTVLSNREKIMALLSESISTLQGEELDSRGARDLAAGALRAIRSLAAIDSSANAWVGQVEEAEAVLHDVARALVAYRDGLDLDPARLEQVQDRLHLLDQLKRKYGSTIEGILSYRDKALASLEELDTSEERILKLQAEEQRLVEEVNGFCEELSQKRQIAAQELAAKVNEVLAELGMQASQFSVSLFQEEMTESGTDSCEFMIAAGPGEPPMPLRKAGSSGEISRVMLGLKSVLGDSEDHAVVVLDEIDVGVGARSADMLGKKLAALARSHQVLCVTHLPSLAAYADGHFRVKKVEKDGRTTVQVDRLGEKGRLKELGLMVGTKNGAGGKVAEEMLDQARSNKSGRVKQMTLA